MLHGHVNEDAGTHTVRWETMEPLSSAELGAKVTLVEGAEDSGSAVDAGSAKARQADAQGASTDGGATAATATSTTEFKATTNHGRAANI